MDAMVSSVSTEGCNGLVRRTRGRCIPGAVQLIVQGRAMKHSTSLEENEGKVTRFGVVVEGLGDLFADSSTGRRWVGSESPGYVQG